MLCGKFSLALVLSVWLIVAVAAGPAKYFCVRNTGGVNLRLRSGVGTDTSIITSMPPNARVLDLAKPLQSGSGYNWRSVEYGAHHGYAANEFLAPCAGPNPSLPTPSVHANGYIGCFIDDSSRDLDDSYADAKMTTEKCRLHCGTRGFAFAGLQFGTQCFCGDKYGQIGFVSDSECNTACGGDSKANCGGAWRNSVWKSKLPPPPTTPPPQTEEENITTISPPFTETPVEETTSAPTTSPSSSAATTTVSPTTTHAQTQTQTAKPTTRAPTPKPTTKAPTKPPTKAPTKAPPPPPPKPADKCTQVSRLAAEKIACRCPYVWGGTSCGCGGHGGFDCSGICFWAHNTAKVTPSIPRTASAMYNGHGKQTKCHPSRMSACQPGDLLFYCYPGGSACPNHVNMYIGDGKIADCPHTGLDCRILTRVVSPSAFYGSKTYCR